MENKKRTGQKRPKKGQPGYINAQKRRRLLKTVLYFLAAAGIFLLGLCLNKFEKSNIFTIIAVLFVLPATKAMVSYIVLFPFHSVPVKNAEKVAALMKEANIVYTDMVFTSTEKVMFLSFLVIARDEILCLAGREKEDTAYMERYLREELKKRMLSYKVYITKDEKNFLSKVEHTAPAETIPEELTDYLRSLMV